MNNYLLVENASKSFGVLNLFNNITFSVNEGEKVALIARNGAGKSTLLNILAENDTFDSGSYYLNKNIKTGYLQQNPEFNPELTVFETLYGSSGELIDAVRNYEHALHRQDPKKLEEAIAMMDFHSAWDLDAKIRQMLGVLNLNDEDQKVGSLSGGQLKRLALAVTLIGDPEFLILDEPTNHLDLDMIEWLEEYLTRSQVTLLMVTHDRYFLDRVCHSILEIDEKEIYTYKGNYSYFLTHREERLSGKSQFAEKARNLLRTELDWMRRMPKARTSKPKYRIDAFYDLQKRSQYNRDESKVDINVASSRLGKKILVMNKVSRSFGDTVILDEFSYTFSRREKLGIIGPNGTGKSTFLNIITGMLQPGSGAIEQGETVVYGYYRQQGLEFKSGKKVIDVLRDIAETVSTGDGGRISISQFLTRFLFPPETQQALVDTLSGGEKRRLYLMTILMQSPNFLVLDEPTNDFDILTLNVLEEYLAGFGGCLIIVSHDRYFMDKLVDHLFIFEGNGVIYDFPGNYSDYRVSRRMEETNEPKASDSARKNQKQDKEKPVKKKLTFKEKQELEQLTSEIESLENEKSALEREVSGGDLSLGELTAKSKRIGELIGLIDKKSDRWLELSEI